MFQASVDQIGYALDLDFKGGNLGVANVDSRFQPPRGVGLTLGFEKARGGGYLFLDPDKGEYAGVLQIDFGRSSLTAIGILTTKDVPGTDNWALLMILFAKTAAPTPGLGFVLTGFGGVIGVNHAVDEEAFRNGLRTKALDDVLFPKDPVANASRILATLRSVFPATGDKAIVGIAAEFSYLASKRVVIRIGVIVQFGESGPERIVILGQLKVSAPGEKNGLLTLNADLFGDIQWGEKQVRIAIDTRLYDSKIGAKGAEFVITGSLSIRVTLGCDSMFLLTAGGFRPDFEVPAELHLPAKLDRFGFKLDQGIARITLAGYFAITPCTVQLGVEVELVAKKFGFSVEVRAAIHALLDEVEGRFTVDLELSAALKRGSTTLMKIELKLTISGPGPWRAAGSAKFKLFFFSKTICFDCDWGVELSTVVQAVDALAGLAVELGQPANWGALPAGTALVSLAAGTSPGVSLIHPMAELTVQQRLLPLGMRVNRIGGNPVAGPDTLDIGAVVVGGRRTTDLRPITNEFARAQFVDMTDDEALALPSFEALKSGVVVAPAGVTGGTVREQAVVYETFYPFAEDAPPAPPPPNVCTFDFVVLAAERGAVARTATPMTGTALFAAELPDVAVSVMPRRFALADIGTMAAEADGGAPLHVGPRTPDRRRRHCTAVRPRRVPRGAVVTGAAYQFFPWVARGVGAGLGEPDTGDTLPDRLRVDVGVEVNGAVVATTKVQVHGPGDVLGIDPRQIVRTEPTAGTTDFEPNYFAHLELGEAALPWLFTPAAPDLAADQLRPWCVLVVVAVQDGVTVGPGKVLPVLEISRPAIPGRELPDLAESWAWVHAQAVAAEGTTPQQALAGDERLSLARLLCPRRLDPLTSYHACLVPAFDTGVAAGLGEPVSTETSIAPAWHSGDDAPAELRLPVYHHWQFATGPVGDFESLVQRLQPRPVPATVGRRAMYLGAAGSGLPELRPDAPGAVVGLEGALRPVEQERQPIPDPVGEAVAAALQRAVDSGADRRAGDARRVTPLGAPLYGRWPAQRHTIDGDTESPRWLRSLNVDPRDRAAAAAGVRAVQANQEALVHSAWEQLGEVESANRRLRELQLARATATSIHRRHLAAMAPPDLVQLLGPAASRVRLASATLHGETHDSVLPDASLGAAFRKVTRPTGRLARSATVAPTGRVEAITSLSSGALRPMAERSAPDGAVLAAGMNQLVGSVGGAVVPGIGWARRRGRVPAPAQRSCRGVDSSAAAADRDRPAIGWRCDVPAPLRRHRGPRRC